MARYVVESSVVRGPYRLLRDGVELTSGTFVACMDQAYRLGVDGEDTLTSGSVPPFIDRPIADERAETIRRAAACGLTTDEYGRRTRQETTMSEPQKPELVAVPPDLAAARNRENPPDEPKAVADATPPNPEKPVPAVGPIRLMILGWLAGKPWWVTAIAVGLMAFGGAVIQHYRAPAPEPTPTPPAPVVNVTLQQPPAVSQGVAEAVVGRERVAGQRLFGRMMREKVSAQLQKDGFKLAGGDPTPLSKEKADALMKRLDDEVVAGVYGEVSGDTPEVMRGPVIDFFRRIIEWIRTHPEEFKRIISLLLTILMMFLDVPA